MIHPAEPRRWMGPDTPAIIATGPRRADGIAVGIVFETDHPDIAAGFLSDQIAPKAYAYLLVKERHATIATCLRRDFKNSERYLRAAIDWVKSLYPIEIRNPTRFGGYGNFYTRPSCRIENRYYVGECAGFQDALWGFGMRFAIESAYLAAISLIQGSDYDHLWKQHIAPRHHTSLVNRFLWEKLGHHGYRWVIRKLGSTPQLDTTLRQQVNPCAWKSALFPFVNRWAENLSRKLACHEPGCTCIWCECHNEKVKVDKGPSASELIA